MGENILEVVLKARDEASKTIENLGKSVEEAQNKTQNMAAAFKAAGAIITGVGIAGVAMLTDWGKAAMGSEKEMALVHASLVNVQEAMAKTVITVGGHTTSTKSQTKSLSDSNAALQLQMQSLRLSGKGHEDQIKTIQQSILANKEHALALKTVGDTTKTTTTVIKNHTESVADLWATVEKASKATIKLGFDDEDTAAALVKNLGITKNMKTAQAMLNAEMEMARAKGMDLATATQLLDRAYVNGGASLSRQGILIDKNAKGMDVVNAVYNKYKGTIEETNKTAEQAMLNAQNSINNLKEELGARLMPVINQLATKFADLASRLLNMNPKILDLIVKIVAFGTAFALVAGPLLMFIGFLPLLSKGFAMVSGSLLPMVLILAAVALVAYELYIHWDQVNAALQKAKPFIDNVFKSLQAFWLSIQPALQQVMKLINDFINTVINSVITFVNDNMSTFQNFWTVIVGIFTFALGFIQGFWDTTWHVMLSIIQDVWKIIVGVFEIAWGAIQIILAVGMAIFTGNWDKAWEQVKKGWNTLWGGVKNVFVGWWDLIVDYLKGVVNVVIGLINGITSGINKVSMGKINIPEIPHFANGGWVNDTGLAFVHQGEFVLSNAMLAGRQSVPSNVNSNNQNNQSVNIGSVIVQSISDIDLLGQRLAFQLATSGRL